MKTPVTISAIAHAAVLLWGLISFAAHPLDAAPTESLPVDLISDTDFSTMTAGTKTAPKAPTPKPLVEKVADTKPVDDPAAKVDDKKPEVITTAEKPPTPDKTPDVKPAPKPPEAKPEPKPEDAQKKPDPKPDPIAEALKKDDAHKPEPKKEAKVTPPMPPKKQPTPQPKFDATRIAALLDKRDPQRHVATGATLNNTPALGTSVGNAPKLSQTELDALRDRLASCWTIPAGVTEFQDLDVHVRIQFRQDGSLQSDPIVTNHSSSPYFQIAAEAALRAVRRCAPYSFLPVAKYENWKDVEVNFNPRAMYRG